MISQWCRRMGIKPYRDAICWSILYQRGPQMSAWAKCGCRCGNGCTATRCFHMFSVVVIFILPLNYWSSCHEFQIPMTPKFIGFQMQERWWNLPWLNALRAPRSFTSFPMLCRLSWRVLAASLRLDLRQCDPKDMTTGYEFYEPKSYSYSYWMLLIIYSRIQLHTKYTKSYDLRWMTLSTLSVWVLPKESHWIFSASTTWTDWCAFRNTASANRFFVPQSLQVGIPLCGLSFAHVLTLQSYGLLECTKSRAS